MQTPFADQSHPVTLFSRERRRQRMLRFLESFERRSWRCAAELPFLLPFSKGDLRESDLASGEARRG
jgi:hypothetical protein